MMRFFQLAIVIFWLGSIGWLAKTILTPDEAGMVEVDPRRPVKIFFDWNDTNRMLLLQNGRKLGEIQVVGFSADEKGNPAGFSLAVMLNGDVSASVIGTFARSLFRFDSDFSFLSSDFLFRMPSNNFKVLASIKADGDIAKAEATLAGSKIFTYDCESDDKLDPGILGSIENVGAVSEALSKAGNPADWKWDLKAFRGMHSFEGKRLPVYLLKLSMDQTEQSIRLFLSESGEPLQIDTDLGFEAISEMLAPVERIPLEREAIFPEAINQ